MLNNTKINVFWFRRDLRLNDNHGLYKALIAGKPVLPIFIFDTTILNKLSNKADRRVQFIHKALSDIHQKLLKLGSGLKIFHGSPLEVFPELINEFKVANVFTNHDYEPYAIERDLKIQQILTAKGIGFNTYKDQVIFEKGRS